MNPTIVRVSHELGAVAASCGTSRLSLTRSRQVLLELRRALGRRSAGVER